MTTAISAGTLCTATFVKLIAAMLEIDRECPSIARKSRSIVLVLPMTSNLNA